VELVLEADELCVVWMGQEWAWEVEMSVAEVEVGPVMVVLPLSH
jgi:hypothetical protein